jgi:hypothetical protein
MDWEAASRRADPATAEGRIFGALQRLAAARRSTEALRSDAATTVLHTESSRVLAYARSHPRAAPLLGLACFSDTEELVDHAVLEQAGIRTPLHLHSTTGRLDFHDGRLWLPPWGFAWVTTP